MCSSAVPKAFVQISAPARTLVLYQCNPNKVNHFTTTLYHPVTYWTSLPNCALNTLVTKHIPVVLWFDCGLWQCISQVSGLCNWSTMYILQLKIGGSVSVSSSSVAVYLYLQPTCPNAPSRQGRSLLASSAWGAHKLLDFGLPLPPPLGESGIRYNLRVSENFCDPQYQGQEIKWNYVTLPTYSMLPGAKTPKNQSNPTVFLPMMADFGIFCSKMKLSRKLWLPKPRKQLPAQNGKLFDNDDENWAAMPAITVDHF